MKIVIVGCLRKSDKDNVTNYTLSLANSFITLLASRWLPEANFTSAFFNPYQFCIGWRSFRDCLTDVWGALVFSSPLASLNRDSHNILFSPRTQNGHLFIPQPKHWVISLVNVVAQHHFSVQNNSSKQRLALILLAITSWLIITVA